MSSSPNVAFASAPLDTTATADQAALGGTSEPGEKADALVVAKSQSVAVAVAAHAPDAATRAAMEASAPHNATPEAIRDLEALFRSPAYRETVVSAFQAKFGTSAAKLESAAGYYAGLEKKVRDEVTVDIRSRLRAATTVEPKQIERAADKTRALGLADPEAFRAFTMLATRVLANDGLARAAIDAHLSLLCETPQWIHGQRSWATKLRNRLQTVLRHRVALAVGTGVLGASLLGLQVHSAAQQETTTTSATRGQVGKASPGLRALVRSAPNRAQLEKNVAGYVAGVIPSAITLADLVVIKQCTADAAVIARAEAVLREKGRQIVAAGIAQAPYAVTEDAKVEVSSDGLSLSVTWLNEKERNASVVPLPLGITATSWHKKSESSNYYFTVDTEVDDTSFELNTYYKSLSSAD